MEYDYTFKFEEGKLQSLPKKDWPKVLKLPEVGNVDLKKDGWEECGLSRVLNEIWYKDNDWIIYLDDADRIWTIVCTGYVNFIEAWRRYVHPMNEELLQNQLSNAIQELQEFKVALGDHFQINY